MIWRPNLEPRLSKLWKLIGKLNLEEPQNTSSLCNFQIPERLFRKKTVFFAQNSSENSWLFIRWNILSPFSYLRWIFMQIFQKIETRCAENVELKKAKIMIQNRWFLIWLKRLGLVIMGRMRNLITNHLVLITIQIVLTKWSHISNLVFNRSKLILWLTIWLHQLLEFKAQVRTRIRAKIQGTPSKSNLNRVKRLSQSKVLHLTSLTHRTKRIKNKIVWPVLEICQVLVNRTTSSGMSLIMDLTISMKNNNQRVAATQTIWVNTQMPKKLWRILRTMKEMDLE